MDKSVTPKQFEKNAARELILISLAGLIIAMLLVLWGFKVILGL